MLLRNLHTIHNEIIDISIPGEKISHISRNDTAIDDPGIHFDNAIVFPGLINAHDHLELNVFPKIGNRIYQNYREWGTDIHLHNKDIINDVLKIPIDLRTQWGIYKNLICGVTTVVNHGAQLQIDNELINVVQKIKALHSVGFEKSIFLKLNNPLTNSLIQVHVGEGTDAVSHKEITDLLKWNFIKKKIIAIHGIAMDSEQAHGFHALAWCPDSNYFLVGATAPIDKLKQHTTILFGTDSTLTAHWNIWEHIRKGRTEKMLTNEELYNSLTTNAANACRLQDTGSLKAGYNADIVIANIKNGATISESFYNINPEDILLVMHKGNVRLYDETLQKQVASNKFSNFSKITINGKSKFVEGDLPGLIQKIKSYSTKAAIPIH